MALGRLYLKAAVGAVGSRARELPATVLVRSGVGIDRARLAEYARVCGFAFDDALPPTYPHVLAFPLQVELMAARSFPLPLPGLVHVGNTITVHRRIGADERLDVRVHAERFVSHAKGAQVDLVARVEVGGETVWDGRSTYLARGASAPAGGPSSVGVGGPASIGVGGPASTGVGGPGSIGVGGPVGADAGGRGGQDPSGVADGPASAVWRVGAGTGRRYAGVSGDVNPIHLHPLTARAFGFPRAIAHGMWTAAHALAALQGRLPEALSYDVAFGKPLLLPSTVELRTRVIDGVWDLDVRSTAGVPHLRGEVRPA